MGIATVETVGLSHAPDRTPEERRARHDALRAEVHRIKEQRGCSMTDIAKEAGIAYGTFSSWVADGFDITDVAISFFLVDMPAAAAKTRWHVRFDLQYSDGSQDEITVFQPIGAATPAGLVAADVTASALSIGGELVTVNGVVIHA